MAAPAPTVSNPETVTVAAAMPRITLAAPDPATLPASGGPVVLDCTTNLPDGTTLNLLVNGAPTGLTATTAGGRASFRDTVLPNQSTTSETLTFTVST